MSMETLAGKTLEQLRADIADIMERKRANAVAYQFLESAFGKRWLDIRRRILQDTLEYYRRIDTRGPSETIARELVRNQEAERLLRAEIDAVENAKKRAETLDSDLQMLHDVVAEKERVAQLER
jgi:hypothetical protein